MSNDYILIKGEGGIEGTLAISKNVFRDIAKQTIQDNDNFNIPDNFLQNNVLVNFKDGALKIDVDLQVKYGNRVIGVLENIQKKIHETVTSRTSLTDVVVDINVIGFIF